MPVQVLIGMKGSAILQRALASRTAPLVMTTVLSALGAALVTWPLPRDMARATLRSGEVLLTAWQLNWFQQALLSNPRAWIDANIFFPYDGTAAFNDLLMAHAIVTLPAAVAESPVLALNLALLGGIVLCGVCAHLLIDEITGERWAAVAGGTLFALTPFRFLHLGHVSIAAAWAVPLFFWALLRHLRQPSWRRAVVASVCGIAVGLSSLYHAAYVAPLAPLVLAVGARGGPGGRRTWVPLAAAGLAGLAALAFFLLPFAVTLRVFGVSAAPGDLLRYGADLSSLARNPSSLTAGAAAGIDPEAHLYPGSALLALAAAAAVLSAASGGAGHRWRARAAIAVLALAGASLLGFVFPPVGALRNIWRAVVLILIWLGPAALAVWAIAAARQAHGRGATTAIRLGLAGAAISFVLALGPQARYLDAVIGPAPYRLLAEASAAFEGTRVPARFGGLVVLFLALAAGGTLAALMHARGRAVRLAGAASATAAVISCFVELPVPDLPRGHELVALPRLRDPAYRWMSTQPGRFGILELPDWPADADVHYRHREWRSLRHMLASKQHGQHLVNGTGRVEPFLWQRFRWLEPWSDEFFTYISAYFPIRYVLVHDDGLPEPLRVRVTSRLAGGRDGWHEAFRSSRIGVYRIDRSFGHGAILDRLFLRRDIAPAADVAFSARLTDTLVDPAPAGGASATLELLRDGDLVGSWPLAGDWQNFSITIPIPDAAPEQDSGWPRAGTLLRWRVSGDQSAAAAFRDITVNRSQSLGLGR